MLTIGEDGVAVFLSKFIAVLSSSDSAEPFEEPIGPLGCRRPRDSKEQDRAQCLRSDPSFWQSVTSNNNFRNKPIDMASMSQHT